MCQILGMKIVVGLPSFNEARTIQKVVEAADVGTRQAFPDAEIVLVNADNGSSDGTPTIFLSVATAAQKIAIDTSAQGGGKGTNMLAILRHASDISADATVFIDTDVTSVEPSWLKALLEPALATTSPVVVTPAYGRSRYEAIYTNHLVRPVLEAVAGASVSQPIAGEFAFNQSATVAALSWTRGESENYYGIDVFLTGNALIKGLEVHEVALTRKVHEASFDSKIAMTEQIIESLFRVVISARTTDADVKVYADEDAAGVDDNLTPRDITSAQSTALRMNNDFNASWLELKALFDCLPDTPDALRVDDPRQLGLPSIDMDLWVSILADAIHKATNESLIQYTQSMAPLVLCRAFTFWREVTEITSNEVEELLRNQREALRAIV